MRERIAGFEFAEHGDVLVAAIEGEIDSSNAAELRLALSDRLPSEASGLILDLTEVSYLDSSGIQLLFELGRRLAARRQAIRLVLPRSAPLRRVLELCAIENVAPVDDQVTSALRAIVSTDVA